MAAVRSRIRQREGQGQSGEAGAHRPAPLVPHAYLLMAGLAALIGTVLVAAAFSRYANRRSQRDERTRLAYGLTLLDELDDLACDYYYNAKDKVNNGRLPDEAWAPFRRHVEAGHIFDAVIMVSAGFEDRYADACMYRDGKATGGTPVQWEMGRSQYYGPPGPPPEPKMGQVQIIEGFVRIGSQRAPVLFLRRPILHPKHGTGGWFGRAVIILHRDAAVPEPSPVPAPPAGNSEPKPAG